MLKKKQNKKATFRQRPSSRPRTQERSAGAEVKSDEHGSKKKLEKEQESKMKLVGKPSPPPPKKREDERKSRLSKNGSLVSKKLIGTVESTTTLQTVEGRDEATHENSSEISRKKQQKEKEAKNKSQVTSCLAAIVVNHKNSGAQGKSEYAGKMNAVSQEWCQKVLEKGPEAVANEYKPIEAEYPHSAIETFKANEDANRYLNTVCLEATRVRVPNGKPNDYIHANFVTVLEGAKSKPYICTQGPLANTVDQFWKMVQAEKVETIAMLCDLSENKRIKCHPYYPEISQETVTFAGISVKNIGKSIMDGIEPTLIESVLLEINDGQGKRLVRHHHWIGWPDHGVPIGTAGMLKLLRSIRSSSLNSPALIHCSAGVGRTGTLVLIAAAIEQLNRGLALDMNTVLARIRGQRAQAVQNQDQFLYAHRVLLDYFGQKAGHQLDGEKLEKFSRDYDAFFAEQKTKRRQPKKKEKDVEKEQ